MKIIFETYEEYQDFIINYLVKNDKFRISGFEPNFDSNIDVCTANFIIKNSNNRVDEKGE